MRRTGCALVAGVVLLAPAAAATLDAQDLQQTLAAAKESAAQNQQALRSYGWIEKVVHQYVPPDPALMQVVANAGGVSLAQSGPTAVLLKFAGYLKQGDALSLTFDRSVKALSQLDVTSYLDSPQDAVTFRVVFQSLPGGPDHPGSVVLGMPARQIEVRITNSSYQKLAQ
jgi:hypothetical protein